MVHALWNAVMVHGVLHVGTAAYPHSPFSYVLDVSSPLLTSGGFEVEASLPAVIGCWAASAYALLALNGDRASERSPWFSSRM